MLALAGCLAGASLMFAMRPSFAQTIKALGQSLQSGSSVAAPTAIETSKQSPSFDFNIPTQSLAAALDRYAVITGNAVLFSSRLAAGRNASAVNGRHDAGAALEMLLQGTGLGVERLHEDGIDTFVLKPLPAQDAAGVAAATASIDEGQAASERYDALVQTRVWETLCSNERTAPGSYRALLRFRVDENGRVRLVRLLGSTGNTRRDTMLTDMLGKLVIGQPPPSSLVQPLTMLMLPQGQIAGRPCQTTVH
ncbi:STN domain-containing protein [Herbaspirillum chlorophenolicum]|uniref:STN domain-containing protein n=1 Tax=Herbaspirillum chlorophenolicum TaxID=211589 RepID=A0ABW8F3V2_9BURK